jgi:hypothetical protein
MIIYGVYRNRKNVKQMKNQAEKDFEVCKFISGAIFICGLTWLFGFLIIIPTPPDAIYLGFALAFIFCILNAFQGVFIFIWAVLLRKLQLKHLKKKTFENTLSGTETSNTDNQDYRRESTQFTNISEDNFVNGSKSDKLEMRSGLKYHDNDMTNRKSHHYENDLTS